MVSQAGLTVIVIHLKNGGRQQNEKVRGYLLVVTRKEVDSKILPLNIPCSDQHKEGISFLKY